MTNNTETTHLTLSRKTVRDHFFRSRAIDEEKFREDIVGKTLHSIEWSYSPLIFVTSDEEITAFELETETSCDNSCEVTKLSGNHPALDKDSNPLIGEEILSFTFELTDDCDRPDATHYRYILTTASGTIEMLAESEDGNCCSGHAPLIEVWRPKAA